ncbi:hypothetical protein BSU04_04485 [Caballeronia sordidicola]|jgi:hypothetical protein|uniref:Uncharacterized protein n=1 Tax=Caballeronia sordidicola TaxID=196367 RepID=A0A226X999_CABSO|nr:hypothetical protein BSU04_04485 [Caballeronia sordidicola]
MHLFVCGGRDFEIRIGKLSAWTRRPDTRDKNQDIADLAGSG